MMLAAGVPLTEAARRLGHSPEMLLRVYAGALSRDEQVANARIEALLAETVAGAVPGAG